MTKTYPDRDEKHPATEWGYKCICGHEKCYHAGLIWVSKCLCCMWEKIGSRYGAQSEYFNDLCGKNTHFIDSPIYKHIKEEIEFLASLMQEDIKYV